MSFQASFPGRVSGYPTQPPPWMPSWALRPEKQTPRLRILFSNSTNTWLLAVLSPGSNCISSNTHTIVDLGPHEAKDLWCCALPTCLITDIMSSFPHPWVVTLITHSDPPQPLAQGWILKSLTWSLLQMGRGWSWSFLGQGWGVRWGWEVGQRHKAWAEENVF